MTDREIIQALECHADGTPSCEECPYRTDGFCTISLSKDILALITRQQAELKELKEVYHTTKLGWATARADAIKEFAERLKAEITTKIEELKATKSKYVKENYKCLSCDYIAKIRGEIEFLESLKEFIDNLVKEMVGEQE